MDLVEEIDSYSPQTAKTKPNASYSAEPTLQINKAPLIEPTQTK